MDTCWSPRPSRKLACSGTRSEGTFSSCSCSGSSCWVLLLEVFSGWELLLWMSRAERSGNALSQQSQTKRWNLLMQRRRLVSHQTCGGAASVRGRGLRRAPAGGGGEEEHLCDVGELFAGEVDERQVVEAGGDGGVVLDEGAPVGVLGEELVDPRVVTQQPPVGSERQAAEVTPAKTP